MSEERNEDRKEESHPEHPVRNVFHPQHEHREHHEKHTHHEHHTSHAPRKRHRKTSHWKIIAGVLAILFVVSLATDGFKFGGISENEASEKTLSFINKNLLQGQAVAELKQVKEERGLYTMTLDIDGEEIDSYVTKDGSLLFPQAIDLDNTPSIPTTATPEPVDLPKTDKPKVELFVMSHCPFGTQAEKGIIPVVERLAGKIDFEIKFVSYAMHGKEELDEQLNQYCIQKEQGGKFFPYMKCFLDGGDGAACLVEAEVDKTMMDSCVEKADTEFKVTEMYNDQSTWSGGRFPQFNIHKAENELYGVRGSPGLVINGEMASSGRSPAEYLATICDGFSTPPAECMTELSTTAFTPGFGYEEGAATAASCG